MKRSRGRWRSLCAGVLSIVLGAGGALAATVPAEAATDAQLQVAATAVDPATGAAITSTSPGQYGGKVGIKVDFSCLVADCAGASVKLDPTQLDPNLSYYRLLVQSGFSAPVSGGTISGSAAAGYTVSLGDLVAGQAGSFTVEYSQAPRPGDHIAWRDGEFNGWAVANFPVGFPITQTVTGTSTTAAAPSVSTTTPVIWQNTVADAGVTVTGVPATARVDADYTYKIYMTSGCVDAPWNGAWGAVLTPSPRLCAEKYEVVHRLPVGVELVSAAGNPVVTGTAATGIVLTWSRDRSDWAPKNNAEAGWQSLDGSYNDNAASPRAVTVRFPRATFAPAGQSCNFSATVGPWKTDVSVGYIAMPGENGVVKSASHTTGELKAVCGSGSTAPFGKAVADAKTSTFDGTSRLANGDSPVSVPVSKDAVNEKQWQVTVGNQSNVDGVAVITDDSLGLADAPVYRIETNPSGATVAWSATNGSQTTSGTSPSPVDAPDGYWFTKAKITSPTLAGPNMETNQSARTNFSAVFKYRVSSTAPAGERRTNEASAVMTFPNDPGIADIKLTVPPHTIQFAQPFAKAGAYKYVQGQSLVQGEYRLPIPASGTGNYQWEAQVGNRANVPGVGVIEEDDLRAPGNLPVNRISTNYHNGVNWVGVASTLEYTLDDGTKATVTIPVGQTFNAPAGRSFVAARLSAPMGAYNSNPARDDQTLFAAYFGFTVTAASTPDALWKNTATATMTYPDHPSLDDLTFDVSATARLTTALSATLGRQLSGGVTTAGPATTVTFTVGGTMSGIASATRPATPQYVFVAPEGWTIDAGSAAFPAGSTPPGVQFSYRTVTVAGVERQAVVAQWPEGTVFGASSTLPTMTLTARPGVTVPMGTVGVPDAYIGRSGDRFDSETITTPVADAPDFDQDGDTAERFARANNTAAGTAVSLQPALQVLKEICLPNTLSPDGCTWITDPKNPVGVAPDSTSISYRLSIANVGNSMLSDVVAYDVLPYVGDTGTSDPTGSTPRGSTFRASVQSVTVPSNGAELAFSSATQPCRPEVDATVPGCVDDWGTTASGAQAIRLTRTGDLAPGERVSVRYTAAVHDAPSHGAVACNSIAAKVGGLSTVSEPSPVCATIEETDLKIQARTASLQQGRPGVLPLTVTNLGGSPTVMGTVAVSIPSGLTVTSLTPAGWTCTATDGAGDPLFGSIAGPATLTCTPASALAKDVPVNLDIPVLPTAATFEVVGKVTGQVYDPDLSNNTTRIKLDPAPAASSGLEVTKNDGAAQAAPGDELTYTVTVRNPLVFETVSGAVLTDILPSGTAFVSASDGGTEAGGVVSWNLPDLKAEGSIARTVTIRVLPTVAQKELVNIARVSAPDPIPGSGAQLTGSGEDRDRVVTKPGISVTKSADQTGFTSAGESITYRFSIKNTGDVTLSNVALSDPLAGLSAISIVWPGTAGTLKPSESATASATYTTTQGDADTGRIVNTVAVTSLAPDKTTKADASASHTIDGAGVAHISLDKKASGSPTRAGDSLSYTFTVLNDGDVTLRGVTVTDTLPGLSAISVTWPGTEAGTLAPGQKAVATATYAVKQADFDAGSVSNTATASGTPQVGKAVTSKDSVTTTLVRNPDILLDKRVAHAEGTRGTVGERLQYTFTIQNPGNVTLRGVAIDDRLTGLSALTYAWPGAAGVLPPGQIATATAWYTVTQGDVDAQVGVTNTAKASGTSPDGRSVSKQATATASTPATSGIQIAITAVRGSTGIPHAGDAVEYRFAVTNLGDLSLSEVEIADELAGLGELMYDWPGASGGLASGGVVVATATYHLTQADIDAGFLQTTATTSGRASNGALVTDDDTATILLEAAPAVTLEKVGTRSGSPLGAAVGDTVTYTLTAENTGNVTLNGVRIDDALPGLSALTYDWSTTEGALAPGETVTATATYRLTAADLAAGKVTNAATVVSDEGATASDSVDVTAQAPLLPPILVDAAGAVTGALARTGVQITLGIVLAAASLGAGLALLLLRRRRGDDDQSVA